MTKIVEINHCEDCPHFDNEYYSYSERCKLLKRIIKQTSSFDFRDIPDDCPLEDKK